MERDSRPPRSSNKLCSWTRSPRSLFWLASPCLCLTVLVRQRSRQSSSKTTKSTPMRPRPNLQGQMHASGERERISREQQDPSPDSRQLTIVFRTVAVTPMKARSLDPAEVKRVCQTCTLAGLQAIWDAKPTRPFRFIYMSADGLPRNTNQKPYFMPGYMMMRVSLVISPRHMQRLVPASSRLRRTGRDGKLGARVCGQARKRRVRALHRTAGLDYG